MKRLKKHIIIIALVCATLFTVPVTSSIGQIYTVTVEASSDASGWIKDGSWSSVYGGGTSGSDSNYDAADEPGWFEKLFAGLIAKFGNALYTLLDAMGCSMDKVIRGRVGTGRTVNVFGFELQKGNPFGIIGAYVYSVLKAFSYGFMAIAFIWMLVKQAFNGNGRSREEFKLKTERFVAYFVALNAMPYILNIALFMRDTMISRFTGDDPNGIYNIFYGPWKDGDSSKQTLLMSLMVLGCVLFSVWLMISYAGVAMNMTIHFALFPVVISLDTSTDGRLKSWISGMLSGIATPVIDCFLLLIVGYMGQNTTLSSGGEIAGAFMQLCLCMSIIPAREQAKRILGMEPDGGAIGMGGFRAALGAMQFAKNMAGGIHDFKDKHDEKKEARENAAREEELQHIDDEERERTENEISGRYADFDSVDDESGYDDHIDNEQFDSGVGFDDETDADVSNDGFESDAHIDGEQDDSMSDFDESLSDESERTTDNADGFDDGTAEGGIDGDAGTSERQSGRDFGKQSGRTRVHKNGHGSGNGTYKSDANGHAGNNTINDEGKTEEKAKSASDMVSERMNRQQKDLDDLEKQKNEVNAAMVSDNAEYNSKMSDIDAQQKDLQGKVADAKATVQALDSDIAKAASDEADARARMAEIDEKIGNEDYEEGETEASLTRERRALNTAAARAHATQARIKSGSDYKNAKDTIANNEQKIKDLDAKRQGLTAEHTSRMDGYRRQLNETDSAITAGRQEMSQLRNDMNTLANMGANSSGGGYSAGSSGRVSTGAGSQAMSYDEQRRQVYAQRADINNFEQPEYFRNLSHGQRAELYRKKARMLGRQQYAQAAGNIAGNMVGFGSTMFFSPQAKAIAMEIGGSIGGSVAGSIAKGVSDGSLYANSVNAAATVANGGRRVADAYNTFSDNPTETIRNVAGRAKGAAFDAAGRAYDGARRFGEDVSNVRSSGERMQPSSGRLNNPGGSSFTTASGTYTERPLPTDGAVHPVQNDASNRFTTAGYTPTEPDIKVHEEYVPNSGRRMAQNLDSHIQEQERMNEETRAMSELNRRAGDVEAVKEQIRQDRADIENLKNQIMEERRKNKKDNN